MVNILGDSWKPGQPDAANPPEQDFAHDNLKLHLYAKHEARPGKMGHFRAG